MPQYCPGQYSVHFAKIRNPVFSSFHTDTKLYHVQIISHAEIVILPGTHRTDSKQKSDTMKTGAYYTHSKLLYHIK